MKIMMKIIAAFLAVTVTVSMTGCAYTHPNPILRDASYGATAGALPGLAMMALLDEVDDDGETTDDELNFFGLSLIVLGGGAVIGLALGAVVGVFHWMYQTATWEPPEEEATRIEPAAVQQVETEAAEDAAIEEPAAVETAGEDITEEDYAPQAITR